MGGLWIPDLDLICMGWVLIGREVDGVIVSEVDVGMVMSSEFRCSTEMDVEEVDVGGTNTIVMGD